MTDFPEYFLIQTTSHCNARCLICPYTETYNTQDQGKMGDDVFQKILDEASAHQDTVKQIMPYLMNEPLLDPYIVGKIDYIHQMNPKSHIHLVTNGTLLKQDLADKILHSPLNSMKISMLGFREETYRKTMGIENHQKAVERIVRFALEARRIKGENYLSICFTNTPGNVEPEEIDEAKVFWEKNGVKYEIINRPISRAGNVSVMDTVKHQSISGCNSIWRDKMIHILFNGDVVLCCMDWRREVVLGNVQKQSIEEIWNSKKYAQIRAIIAGQKKGSDDLLCYKCEAAIPGKVVAGKTGRVMAKIRKILRLYPFK